MPENKVVSLDERAKDEEKPFLEQLLQEGARKLLQTAIENEVIDYNQRLVVRNGHLPEREVISGVGPIPARFVSHGSGISTDVLLAHLAGAS